MKERVYIVFSILLLVSCTQKSDQRVESGEATGNRNPFEGVWESIDRGFPYKSHLIINLDSTFEFEYGACMSFGYSQGNWLIKDSIIILNSFETDSCFYLSNFGVDCFSIDDYSIETTKPECEPTQYIDYIRFDQEEFYVENDTLKHVVKGQKRCPEIKNNFFRGNEDTTANTH